MTQNRLNKFRTSILQYSCQIIGPYSKSQLAWAVKSVDIFCECLKMGYGTVMALSHSRIKRKSQVKWIGFFKWWNKNDQSSEGIIRAAIAHFWFVSIHPSDDGSGRLARVLTNMYLGRDENTQKGTRDLPPFYS